MGLKKGVFYGVGVGPGDPELLTLKAVRILGACPVLAVPQTKSGETLALDILRQAVPVEEKTIVRLSFTMAHSEAVQHAAHKKAAAAVERYLADGQDVAMPSLGDVGIYSTFCYLMPLLRARGYETVMIPGVPSFCAVAARLGASLTLRNEPLHILSAGDACLAQMLTLPGTKIVMKSGKRMARLTALLQEKHLLQKARLVENCCLSGERMVTDLQQPAAEAGYFATVVVKEEWE